MTENCIPPPPAGRSPLFDSAPPASRPMKNTPPSFDSAPPASRPMENTPPSLIVEFTTPNSDLRKKSYREVLVSGAARSRTSPLVPRTSKDRQPVRKPDTGPPPPKIFREKEAREPPDLKVKSRRKRRHRKRKKNTILPATTTENSDEKENCDKLISTLSSLIDDIRESELESLNKLFTDKVNKIQDGIVKNLTASLKRAIARQEEKLNRAVQKVKRDLVKLISTQKKSVGSKGNDASENRYHHSPSRPTSYPWPQDKEIIIENKKSDELLQESDSVREMAAAIAEAMDGNFENLESICAENFDLESENSDDGYDNDEYDLDDFYDDNDEHEDFDDFYDDYENESDGNGQQDY